MGLLACGSVLELVATLKFNCTSQHIHNKYTGSFNKILGRMKEDSFCAIVLINGSLAKRC
jgi:hypothetical protein